MSEKQESARVQELRQRLEMYKEMERNILTGGAQSYEINGRNLSRYEVKLSEIRATIKELEIEINAELKGAARWSGNLYALDN